MRFIPPCCSFNAAINEIISYVPPVERMITKLITDWFNDYYFSLRRVRFAILFNFKIKHFLFTDISFQMIADIDLANSHGRSGK